ncbi:hypothetical protein AB6A40_010973 [Gnathostoma spinigerum]|uniref:Uncharacterized protein n=1 Tax=Gnathostoma spinigerum TaxID=75299 RepID=A0ABD6F0W6_9BILA
MASFKLLFLFVTIALFIMSDASSESVEKDEESQPSYVKKTYMRIHHGGMNMRRRKIPLPLPSEELDDMIDRLVELDQSSAKDKPK